MATITIYADQIQIIDPNAPDSAGNASSITAGSEKQALLHFSFPDALKYRVVSKIQLYLYSTPGGTYPSAYPYIARVHYLTAAFDSSVTYNTAPAASSKNVSLNGSSSAAQYNAVNLESSGTFSPHDVFAFGLLVTPGIPSTTPLASLSTSTSSNAPYVVVTYGSTDQTGHVSGTPSSGYVSKNESTTFRYSYTAPTDIVAGDLSVASWRFAYRKTSSGAFTFENAGTALSYTAPADTFSDTDTVYWYPEITLSDNQVMQVNPPYQLSTVEPTFAAVAISPDSTIEDGSAAITFSWTAFNSVGTLPSGADLQYSTNEGSTWQSLGSVLDSSLSYTAPANTFSGGLIMWRVRAINNAGTAGDWSAALSFICVAAPAAPSVNSNAAPFATVTWNATGQQAYEVFVDGISQGVHFGTEKTFTLQMPLSDGEHAVGVKIQGTYGLWSALGEAQFTVENAPAGSIELTGQFGIDAELFWNTALSGDDFLVFRNGVQIGHTAQNSFSDRRSLGAHAWYVLLRQADGNYTKSNTVTGTLSTEYPAIALLTGGPWLSLRLSENSIPLRQFVYSQTYSLRHFSGSPYPVLELTPYKDLSGTYRCAFSNQAEAQTFEALFGNVVIMKSNESVVIGGMVNLEKVRSTFYAAYQFTLQQIAVEEIVNDPDS